MKEIGPDAFYDCKGLVHIKFVPGSKLEKIGSGSFFRTGLEKILIPKSAEEIQEYAFYECKNLKEVLFEEGSRLKTIGEDAFNGCANLTKMTFPEGLEEIGICAFARSRLKNVEFPASLRTIAQASFKECTGLKTVKFTEGLEVLGTDEHSDDS